MHRWGLTRNDHLGVCAFGRAVFEIAGGHARRRFGDGFTKPEAKAGTTTLARLGVTGRQWTDLTRLRVRPKSNPRLQLTGAEVAAQLQNGPT